MNIYESLATAIAECRAVGKTGENAFDHYKYRSIDAVMNAVSPALARARIAVIPQVLEIQTKQVSTAKGGTQNYTRVFVRYTFYAVDGSNLSVEVYGEGTDRGDKSINKAMAAAYKYCLFQTLCIPTEDMIDSEQDSPEFSRENGTAETAKNAPKTAGNAQGGRNTQPKGQAPEKKAQDSENGHDRLDGSAKIAAKQARAVEVGCANYDIPLEKICERYKVRRIEDMKVSDYADFAKNWNTIKHELGRKPAQEPQTAPQEAQQGAQQEEPQTPTENAKITPKSGDTAQGGTSVASEDQETEKQANNNGFNG